MSESILIAGSGLAGLATALRLSKKGYQVTILEKNEQAGGRLNRISKDGFTFDIGPTFFSMSYEFEQFAKECNMALPFEYYPVDPLYTVNLGEQNKSFVLYRDINKLGEQFKGIEPDFTKKMEAYLQHTGKMFRDTMDIVVRQNFNSKIDYLMQLAKVNKVHLPILFSTVEKQVSNYFSSKEARQIISLVSYFLGSSPEKTNGVYSLLSYTEFIHDGYHNVKGGMYEIVSGLLKELNKQEVKIIYNTEIIKANYDHKRISSFIDQHQQQYSADHYIVNMDAALFRGKILNRSTYSDKKLSKMNWSMGFFSMYIGLDCKLDQIALHNYYIGLEKGQKAMKGFRDNVIPENPYFYVNVVSRYNPGCAPDGCEALMFVVPVPNLIYKEEWSEADKIADEILAEFGRRIHFPIQKHIKTRFYMTPKDWHNQFNLYMGAGLGLSHTMNQTGGLRPQNEDEVFQNLYYTGASTVPGIGLPMAIISSRLTAERILSKRKN
ncbi:MAG: phytoene desaturase family protein [Bacteroidales bacterium]